MKQTTDNEDMMVSYLFGELPEQEQLRLEERFFTNDEYYQQLLALEDELTYDYAGGSLSPEQRVKFERRFLNSPEARQKVELAGAVLGKVAEANSRSIHEPRPLRAIVEEKRSLWQSLLSFFTLQNPALQFGLAAAAAVLLISASGLFYQTLRLRGQVKQLETANVAQQERSAMEAAIIRSRQEELAAQLENERNQRAQLEQELAQQAQIARDRDQQLRSSSTIFSFILAPGLVRDVDGPKRLSIPPGINSIRLQLNLKKTLDYRGYRATLQTLDGAELWSRNLTRANYAASKQAITLSLPVKLLPPGDYFIALKGLNAGGEQVEIDDYYFSVVKP